MSTVSLTIDDQEVVAAPGTNLVEAAKLAGVEVPHYCYHARLSVAGNCRMCLVSVGMPKRAPDGSFVRNAEGKPEIGYLPKLQIGCATTVAEGMVVKTRSPEVVKARQGVMEFLLINHPLDCPICDQAGECRLQEFATDYGRGESRFVELKVHKPKEVSLGPKVVLDNERCILCSRCERFMREVAKQDCLGFVKRGSKTELGCYPGNEPNTNYDLNIVDICPVGALTSRDFRFRMRPWFLKETRSVCPGCATGCNTTVWSRDREVFRLTPRDNDDVNQSWMCDTGRLNYRFINDPKRLRTPLLRTHTASGAPRTNGNGANDTANQSQEPAAWDRALARAVSLLQGRDPQTIAMVGSARASTEELYLFRKLARKLGVERTDSVMREGEGDGYLFVRDRNPNLRGARLMGIAAEPPGSRLKEIAQAIESGTVKVLLVLGEDVSRVGISSELLQTLEGLIVIDILPSATTLAAHVVLPGASYAEKTGTFINERDRLQRFEAAIDLPGEARPEWMTLLGLLKALAEPGLPSNFNELFRQMAAEFPELGAKSFVQVGEHGVVLSAAPASAEPKSLPVPREGEHRAS